MSKEMQFSLVRNGPDLKDKINLESRKITLPKDLLQNC